MSRDLNLDKSSFSRSRVMFTYWGRRGSLSQFALQTARAALIDFKNLNPTISVSRQNEEFSSFQEFGDSLFSIKTFHSSVGALLKAKRIRSQRQKLCERLRRDRIEAVIELMPHVWSPFIMPALKEAGVRYYTILHDADAHPGDPTSYVKKLTDRSLLFADGVITLSSSVAERVIARGLAVPEKVFPLYHPDLNYAFNKCFRFRKPHEPLRLLFLGRILPYKGLPLFIETIQNLRKNCVPVEIGVFGEGDLGRNKDLLHALGAEIVNRWLTPAEISTILPRYHAVVLSHIEASQSGVAATAFGAGLPVIATPVGGLVEQISHGQTGFIAKRVDSTSLAQAAMGLMDPAVYQKLCKNIETLSERRSMSAFLKDILSFVLSPLPAGIPLSAFENRIVV